MFPAQKKGEPQSGRPIPRVAFVRAAAPRRYSSDTPSPRPPRGPARAARLSSRRARALATSRSKAAKAFAAGRRTARFRNVLLETRRGDLLGEGGGRGGAGGRRGGRPASPPVELVVGHVGRGGPRRVKDGTSPIVRAERGWVAFSGSSPLAVHPPRPLPPCANPPLPPPPSPTSPPQPPPSR